ncbi:MAG: T9SS type A sorting domain-containing protein [Pigmentiphaga sp.]|nr:T9SS type A sorting domain-containing protein [Pigmentiphaga sp.]
MKHPIKNIIITAVFILSSVNVFAGNLIDIDFTRDSTMWNQAFPQMTWNANGKDFMIGQLNNYKADQCYFRGAYGRFYGNDPYDSEDQCKAHTYSFRVSNAGNNYIELPEIKNAKDIIIHCRSGNTNLSADFALEKQNGNNWEIISNMSCPANGNSDFDEVLKKELNINKPVKLRIYGASRNLHVYSIKVSDNSETAIKNINQDINFDIWTWNNLLHLDNHNGDNVNISIMDLVGKVVYNKTFYDNTDISLNFSNGYYIVKAQRDNDIITKKIIIK